MTMTIVSIARYALLSCVAALSILSAGCSKPAPPTADGVLASLRSAGVELTDVRRPPRDPSSPLPNSYTERVEFSLPVVAPKGGQVFVCDKPEHCDAIHAYFQVLKALAGPYIYRSKSGVVVAQLNSGLEPAAAEKFGAVIQSLP